VSTKPPIKQVQRALYPEINQPGLEDDYFNAEVRKLELYLHSPIHLNGVVLN
jgi:hypothetical protein